MNLTLANLKRNILIMRNLRWDVTPEVLFRPRFTGVGEAGKERELVKETEGFMFYIDYVNRTPKLMLMRTIKLMSSTQGEVEGAPEEMLMRAVKAEGVKPVAGMYPLNRELEEWLKKELGVVKP